MPRSRRRPSKSRRPRMARAAEPLRLPVVRRRVPPMGGPVPRVRPWNTPRRDGHRSRAPDRARAPARSRAPEAPRPGDVGAAEAPRRASRRGRRARSRPRRRARSRLARPARRRARRRQVDAPAPGRSRCRGRGGRRALRDRRGVARRRSACGRAARPRLGTGGGSASGPRRERGRSRSSRRPGRARPGLVVVDSIQTMTVDELDGPAGQRRPGPRVGPPAHGAREGRGDRGHARRARHEGRLDRGPQDARAPRRCGARPRRGARRGAAAPRATKNRFGSTDEIGVFEMGESGLREVADPARAFLAEHDGPRPEASSPPRSRAPARCSSRSRRSVTPAGYGTPARSASGIDPNRLALLVAVLGRRAGVGLGGHDVYANLAGGLTVAEPGLDLAARPRPRLVAA